MTDVIQELRYAADQVLRVPAIVGLRNEVFLVQNTWSGTGVPNSGNTKTQVITPLMNVDGYINAVQVSANDIALSGGLLKDRDWVIGPIVHPYVATFGSGGTDIANFQPKKAFNAVESYVWLKGPGLPASGSYFKKIYDSSDKSIMYRVYIRDAGITSP